MSTLDDARMLRAEHVFDAVIDLPPEDRAAALESNCGDDHELRIYVERLLEIDSRVSNEFEAPMPFEPPRQWKPPFRIGRFHVQRTLGEGGMGTVYEAEQDHPQRIVALKLMMRGIASRSALRRFEHEAQILARLHHPGIAQVYDAGVFDDGQSGGGIPYFAMEYIPDAQPFTNYAHERNLDTRQRLEMFLQVCDAVHHGHQKGIIHRDLKPGNILVDGDGLIKVIDFGVARATDSDVAVTTMQTDVGQLIGTLQYMSPEQCDADPHDLDVRSDVYALGVVLYELLTDQLPYDVTNARIYEATRIIREESPARPSMFDRALRGDLETITLKALEKDRERRYQSASDLAGDIRRYLTDRPIMARPPSAMYQFRTFARRNKALVGGMAATFIALIAGLIGVSAMYVQAEHLRAAEAEQRLIAEHREAEAVAAREEAEAAKAAEAQRAEELEKVATFQESQLAKIDTQMMGINLQQGLIEKRRAFLVDRGMNEEQIADALAELESSLIGINFTNVALDTLDENIFERALNAIDEQFEDQPLVRARLLQTVADTMRTLGLLERAMAPQTEALDLRRQVLGDLHPDTLVSINNMAVLLWVQGRLAEAEPFSREALDISRSVLGNDDPATLMAINNMGILLRNLGRFSNAEPFYREAFESRLRVLGDEHPDTLHSINNMGVLLRAMGKPKEAEPFSRQALKARRRILGEEHPDTLVSLSNMGGVYEATGRFVEAEKSYREALNLRRRVHGDDHPNTLHSINNLGSLFWRQGKLDDAQAHFREGLEIGRRVFGNEHPETLTSMLSMGIVLSSQGDYVQAAEHYLEAIATGRRVLGDEHPLTLTSINNLGVLLREQGRFIEAEPYIREAMEIRRRAFGNEHMDTLYTISNMSGVLRELGELEKAEQLGYEAVETVLRVIPESRRDVGIFLLEHARTLVAMQRFDEAETHKLEAHEAFTASLGKQHYRTISAIEHLAALYDAWHEAEPDAGHDERAAEWRTKLKLLQHESD